ncbi:hypothetical protein Q5752_002850 [Cryptotrichosporon argae]
MTTLNPSHDPFHHTDKRHGQAVYRAEAPDYPDLDDVDDEPAHARAKARREGRRRVRAAMPPLPDLRFEQSYLVSLRPYLHAAPSAKRLEARGAVPTSLNGQSQKREQAVAAQGVEGDEVFHWGREVRVDWAPLTWVTVRDQIFSPLLQGMFWGVAGIALSTTSAVLRASLFPHPSHRHVAGGPGGSVQQAGDSEAIGGSWWRGFVKSWAGAAETAAA